MTFNENTKIGDLLKSEAAKVVLEKHFPGFTTKPSVGIVHDTSLKRLAVFPQAEISPEQLKACCDDLGKIQE